MSLVSELDTNLKLFQSYMRHRKVNRPTVGPLRFPCGDITDDATKITEVFLMGFSSVYISIIPRTQAPN